LLGAGDWDFWFGISIENEGFGKKVFNLLGTFEEFSFVFLILIFFSPDIRLKNTETLHGFFSQHS
jgi:hypothetical protein